MMRFLESRKAGCCFTSFPEVLRIRRFECYLTAIPTSRNTSTCCPPSLTPSYLTLSGRDSRTITSIYVAQRGLWNWRRRLQLSADGPNDRIHLEYFTAEIPVQAENADTEFELVLQKSSKRLIVKSGQTIIGALQEAGVDILTSCEQGVCGTCVTRVIEGEPDHRDVYFNAQERESGKLITPCVSRCKGKRLVLDL